MKLLDDDRGGLRQPLRRDDQEEELGVALLPNHPPTYRNPEPRKNVLLKGQSWGAVLLGLQSCSGI